MKTVTKKILVNMPVEVLIEVEEGQDENKVLAENLDKTVQEQVGAIRLWIKSTPRGLFTHRLHSLPKVGSLFTGS